MDSLRRVLIPCLGCIAMAIPVGCTAPGARRHRRVPADAPIRRLACIYHPKPWLNLDKTGDRVPEGFQFQVYLDPGTGQGVHRDGIFHIEMYQLTYKQRGEVERKLVSDWHYPTSAFAKVLSPTLGYGYHVQLRWATKETAGHDVEIVTRFEDTGGHIVAGGTKSLAIPKQSS